MKIAIHMGATNRTASPGDVAYEAEARGFDGIFFPEHTHMPLEESAFPYPGSEYRLVHSPHLYNPFIAMAWAASRTTRLKVGASVSLPGQHDPIILAKTLASLDAMSDGRIVYGFGFGWSAQEMIDHGVDPKRRRATVREKMLAVKALWTEDHPSFSGEFVNFPPCRFGPRPPDLSRMPLLLGANGTDQVFDHVIEYCDGWAPSQRGDVADLIGLIARLRSRASDAGRDPATIQVDVIVPEPTPEIIEALDGAGVERVLLILPYLGIDEARLKLDAYAAEFLA